MKQGISKINCDPRCIARAALLWCAAAALLLLLSASAITLADLKASSFPAFSFSVLLVSSYIAAYQLRSCLSAPGWLTALICALGLTVLLLSCGFLIAGKGMQSERILAVAAANCIGSLLGCALGGKGKKLQFAKRFKGRRK